MSAPSFSDRTWNYSLSEAFWWEEYDDEWMVAEIQEGFRPRNDLGTPVSTAIQAENSNPGPGQGFTGECWCNNPNEESWIAEGLDRFENAGGPLWVNWGDIPRKDTILQAHEDDIVEVDGLRIDYRIRGHVTGLDPNDPPTFIPHNTPCTFHAALDGTGTLWSGNLYCEHEQGDAGVCAHVSNGESHSNGLSSSLIGSPGASAITMTVTGSDAEAWVSEVGSGSSCYCEWNRQWASGWIGDIWIMATVRIFRRKPDTALVEVGPVQAMGFECKMPAGVSGACTAIAHQERPFAENIRDRIQLAYQLTSFGAGEFDRHRFEVDHLDWWGDSSFFWDFWNMEFGDMSITSDYGLGIAQWFHEFPAMSFGYDVHAHLSMWLRLEGDWTVDPDVLRLWFIQERGEFPIGFEETQSENPETFAYWVDHAVPPLAELPLVTSFPLESLEPRGEWHAVEVQVPALAQAIQDEQVGMGSQIGFRLGPDVEAMSDLEGVGRYNVADPTLWLSLCCVGDDTGDGIPIQATPPLRDRLPADFIRRLYPQLANRGIAVNTQMRGRSRRRVSR